MLESVMNYMSYFGEVDKRIIEAMKFIDRKKFYPFMDEAYNDIPLEIGKEQTISQPSTVGRMLQLLKLEKGNSCLEIGAGSGWLAALLAYIVKPGHVVSFEFHPELVDFARKNIGGFNLTNLKIEEQDFLELLQSYDRIIFSCGIEKDEEKEIEEWVFSHLKENGVCIVPFREGPLLIFEKIKGKLKMTRTREEYTFAPLLK